MSGPKRSQTSLMLQRAMNQLYAQAGIRDYWVFDKTDRLVHVIRDPSSDGYRTRDRFSAKHGLNPLFVENTSLKEAEIFPVWTNAALRQTNLYPLLVRGGGVRGGLVLVKQTE